jgi:hypothetical protein
MLKKMMISTSIFLMIGINCFVWTMIFKIINEQKHYKAEAMNTEEQTVSKDKINIRDNEPPKITKEIPEKHLSSNDKQGQRADNSVDEIPNVNASITEPTEQKDSINNGNKEDINEKRSIVKKLPEKFMGKDLIYLKQGDTYSQYLFSLPSTYYIKDGRIWDQADGILLYFINETTVVQYAGEQPLSQDIYSGHEENLEIRTVSKEGIESLVTFRQGRNDQPIQVNINFKVGLDTPSGIYKLTNDILGKKVGVPQLLVAVGLDPSPIETYIQVVDREMTGY